MKIDKCSDFKERFLSAIEFIVIVNCKKYVGTPMKPNKAINVKGSTTSGQQSDPDPLYAPKFWSNVSHFLSY